jgi:hypothetical protein
MPVNVRVPILYISTYIHKSISISILYLLSLPLSLPPPPPPPKYLHDLHSCRTGHVAGAGDDARDGRRPAWHARAWHDAAGGLCLLSLSLPLPLLLPPNSLHILSRPSLHLSLSPWLPLFRAPSLPLLLSLPLSVSLSLSPSRGLIRTQLDIEESKERAERGGKPSCF